MSAAAAAKHAQLVAAAQAAWSQRGDEAQTLAAIKAWTEATEIDPGDAASFTSLSRAVYFHADCHMRMDESLTDTDRKNRHDEGTKFAERALVALSPSFAQKMKDGARIEQAISELDARAVPALYWRSSNLGRWATLESFATLLSYKDEIRAVMEFCLNNEPTYFHYGPDRYFGVFYARAPSFAGGDLDKSRAHFEKSMAAEPSYFGTRTLMAEEWAVKTGERQAFETLLKQIIAADPNLLPDVTPENKCEQFKAKKLLSEIDDLF